jgi:hypothetical protein
MLLRQRDMAVPSRPRRKRIATVDTGVVSGSGWLVWCVVALLIASVAVVSKWMPRSASTPVKSSEVSSSKIAPSVVIEPIRVEPVEIAVPRPVVVHDLHPLVLAEMDALRVADQRRHAQALAVVLQLRHERVNFSRALLRAMSPELRAMVVKVLVERSAADGVPPVVAVECALSR